MPDYPLHITVNVPTDSNGDWTYPHGQYVRTGGTVTLKAPANSSDLDVYTRQGNTDTDVFQNVSRPYKAKSNGNPHALLSSISGEVKLRRSQAANPGGTLTSNGIINVGGGGGDDDGNG